MANIIQTATQAGSFTTLVKAIQTAGLADTLNGSGPFTVFAPTDAAFAKLPAGTVDLLLLNPVLLGQILSYHVVQGRYTAADVAGLPSAPTVQGTPLTIDTTSGVKVNSATVVQPDIEADNGVIHAIDQVLLPLPGRQFAEQGAQFARQAVDSLLALNPYSSFAPTRQLFAFGAAQTEAAVQASFAFQNAVIDAVLSTTEKSGGNRDRVAPLLDLLRQSQQTTLEVWRTTTR